jgi:hypothetical protein
MYLIIILPPALINASIAVGDCCLHVSGKQSVMSASLVH